MLTAGSSKNRSLIKNTIRYIFLILFFIFFIFPTVFLIVTALKEDEIQIAKDISSIKAFIPYGKIGLLNFFQVFERMKFHRFFMNSLIITLSTILIGSVFTSMIAFALAKLKFSAKKILLPVLISLIIVPMETLVLPMLLLVKDMGIVNTYLVQIIPFAAEPFFIFLFYQFFRDLPNELCEAALIDGVSFFGIYLRIVMPLSKPVIASVIVFNALWRWGDMLWAVLVTRGEEVRPLALAMQALFTVQPRLWGDIFAFATMMTFPILILYFLFQQHFVRSIASSGIKG